MVSASGTRSSASARHISPTPSSVERPYSARNASITVGDDALAHLAPPARPPARRSPPGAAGVEPGAARPARAPAPPRRHRSARGSRRAGRSGRRIVGHAPIIGQLAPPQPAGPHRPHRASGTCVRCRRAGAERECRMLDVVDVSKSYPTAQGPLAGAARRLARARARAEPGADRRVRAAARARSCTSSPGSTRSTPARSVVAGAPVTGARRRRPRRAPPRRDRPRLPAVQPDPEPRRRGQPRLPGPARRPARPRLAGRARPPGSASATLLARYPEQLSGGQQQRVAIGRALAGRPGLILADEPTGNLDEATGDAVIDLLLELVAAAGASLLLVTHSARLAGAARRARHACTPARLGMSAGARGAARPLAAAPGRARHAARRPRRGDRALERRAGAERRGAGELRPRGGGRSAATRSPRSSRPAGQRLALADYVALRRAGWKVSPVLEGDLRRGADSLRVIGIEPLTLPAEGVAGLGAGAERLRAFVLPPYLALAAPETAARLAGAAGPAAARGRTTRCRPTPSSSTSASPSGCSALERRVSRLLLPPDDAGRRCRPAWPGACVVGRPPARGDLERLTDELPPQPHRLRRPRASSSGSSSSTPPSASPSSSAGRCSAPCAPAASRRAAWPPRCSAELVALALLGGLAGMAAGYAIAARAAARRRRLACAGSTARGVPGQPQPRPGLVGRRPRHERSSARSPPAGASLWRACAPAAAGAGAARRPGSRPQRRGAAARSSPSPRRSASARSRRSPSAAGCRPASR